MKEKSKIEELYNTKQKEWKDKIKAEPKKSKRFWKWVWFFIAFPFVWLFYNCRDWRSLICVLISFALWSATVWVWYLLAFCSGWTTAFAKWCIGIGSAIWVWWLSPVGSPFLLLVSITAIGMKALFNTIKEHCKKKKDILQ